MAVEAIWCTYSGKLRFSNEAMKNMQRLRILLPQCDTPNSPTEYLPNNLCYFFWRHYPWKLLPENFNPRRLVHLDLSWSSLHHLWNETKELPSLRRLNLSDSQSLKRTPDFNRMPNLEYLSLWGCRSLEEVHHSLGCSRNLIELNLSCTSLVSLPNSICKLKGLVKLNVFNCSKLESLPEDIGDLENLEGLHAGLTLISRPPSSIVRLNKLISLTFEKEKSEDRVYFVFPQVNEGLLLLKILDLSCCNLIDGGLPEDIGCLHSLKVLRLGGNNFEHLPHSIAQLGALQTLDLSDCKRLLQLPEFPCQLHNIVTDWSNDSICNSLFQNISSLQHGISVSDSLSLRVFKSWPENIPSWFHHQGMGSRVSVNLPENWYVSDKFLGFAVCYSGEFIDHITAHLIPLCDDGMSSMTQKLALSNHSEENDEETINFLLVPLGGLWDASNANGKTPNDYDKISLEFGEEKEYGVRLLYKDEAELHNGIRKSRYEEASCSSSKK